MIRYPNLFLIGAPKTGTTSLAAELAQHPRVFCPPVKEPRFYDAKIFYDFPEDQNPITRRDYLALYESAPENALWRLDASVFVMYSLDAVRNILSDSPDARFIVVLRDPCDASKSMHAQRLKTLYNHLRELDDDFYRCFDLITERKKGKGFPAACRNRILFRYDLLYSYELWLPGLTALLGDRLLVLRYEDYARDPAAVHHSVFAFLGLPTDFVPTLEQRNRSEVIATNALSRLASGLANRLYRFRRLLGPIWRAAAPLKRRVLRHKQLERSSDAEADAQVRIAFSSTYAFLEELDDS